VIGAHALRRVTRNPLFKQCEKNHARHQRQADQQRVMAPAGYHSKHVPISSIYSNLRPPVVPAAHVLYGGGTVYFQVEIKHVAGLKNAYFKRITAEIALPGPLSRP
jgi:hypothetical protein